MGASDCSVSEPTIESHTLKVDRRKTIEQRASGVSRQQEPCPKDDPTAFVSIVPHLHLHNRAAVDIGEHVHDHLGFHIG